MKRAVNVRLDEQIICTLDKLSKELNSTKTEIIERAIELFSKENSIKKNNLLKFAGSIKSSDANAMLNSINSDKTAKDIDFRL